MKQKILIVIISLFAATQYIVAANKPYVFNQIFSITISDLLELRQDNDAYTHFLKDTLNYDANSEIVFQQKALSIKESCALSRYCRIMMQVYTDDEMSFPTADDNNFSSDDLQELIDACDNELAPGQHFVNKPIVDIKENGNGCTFVQLSYLRSGYSGDVSVRICYFFNYKYAVKAIFSYRNSEIDIWEKPLDEAINSFSWLHPYTSSTYVDTNGEQNNNISSSSDKINLYLGIIIGIIIMSILFASYSLIKSNKRKRLIKLLEQEISDINHLIDKGKIVSAHNKIVAIRCYKEATPNLFSEIGRCEKALRNRTENIDEHISTIIDDVRSTIVNNSDSNHLDDEIAKIFSDDEIPSKCKEKLNECLKEIDNEYRKGIIPEQTEAYVQYDVHGTACDNYCFYIAPNKGTILFPYRRHKVELRGYTERLFQDKLKLSFGINNRYNVLGDVSILPVDGIHPYEPDIAIIETDNKYGIRIDIEIDEPYSGLDKKPIHFIGCGDEFRDRNLSNLGWIVIRFSERQIFKETDKCINYVKYVIGLIDNTIFPASTIFPTPDKRWTEIDARLMAARNYREKLLNHDFGRKEVDDSLPIMVQTENEKKAAKHVVPITLPSKVYVNIDKSKQSFVLDGKLSFDPKEHIYLFDGTIQLKAVSNVIADFFEPFDAIGISERVAIRDGIDQCEVLEDWDSKGLESREVGTFLHTQIESYFLGNEVVNQTSFQYDGEYVHIDKLISIQPELDYFKSFLSDSRLVPFRTEWHICDVELGIAGTIDFISKNGPSYDIYDWKRSRKASPNETVWRYGINGLENVPDISFYHYAIQQNLYRYILEKNYGINISNMFIVIFHSQFDNYFKYQIPKMDKEINIILSHIH